MSTAVISTQDTVSVPDKSHYPAALRSDKKRSIQHPNLLSQKSTADPVGYNRMWDKVSYLWAGFVGIAYEEVSIGILEQWNESEPPNKKFLEKAVDLLVEFQNRPMKSMKDSLEWSNYLTKGEIDSKRFFAWVEEQYELLACKKRKGFEDITLDRFCDSLMTADWKDSNDNSAIVNAYLLYTDTSLKPEIYLGSLGSSRIAVRVNGESLRPQKADLPTVESHAVTAINPDILLAMRYVSLQSDKSKESLLFIPIGNIFRMKRSRDHLSSEIFQEGYWQDTGVVLVLRILKAGGPGGLYMVNDFELRNTEVGGDENPIRLSLDTDPFTLAEVRGMDHRALRRYKGISEKSDIQLRCLSRSKLEIVQTGVKGKWSEGVPPVGLYPIDQKLEGD